MELSPELAAKIRAAAESQKQLYEIYREKSGSSYYTAANGANSAAAALYGVLQAAGYPVNPTTELNIPNYLEWMTHEKPIK